MSKQRKSNEQSAPFVGLSVRAKAGLKWAYGQDMDDDDLFKLLKETYLDINLVARIPNCGAVSLKELHAFAVRNNIAVIGRDLCSTAKERALNNGLRAYYASKDKKPHEIVLALYEAFYQKDP